MILSQDLSTALIVHLIVACIYAALILLKWSSLSPAFIPIIFFIPDFGILSALVAEITNRLKDKLGDTGEIETVKLEQDIYWKTIRRQAQSEGIVPLEEALIINDRQTRKKLVLEMLLDDPKKNIDILLLARENNDVDTAHYANTTIAKIQRDFQLQVQQLAAAYETDPHDSATLDAYIETLGQFIDSGLSEAYLLRRQRLIQASLIDHKIMQDGWTKELLQQKFNNHIALGELNAATETNEHLHENYPRDEQTWINDLKISVAAHDAARLQATKDGIKRADIQWSPANREKVNLWLENAA
jgi:hypothetical protein